MWAGGNLISVGIPKVTSSNLPNFIIYHGQIRLTIIISNEWDKYSCCKWQLQYAITITINWPKKI